jgi:hypothetical protein
MNQSDSKERLPRCRISAVHSASVRSPFAPQPRDIAHPRLEELHVREIAHALEQGRRCHRFVIELRERHAAELLVTDAARGAVRRMDVIAVLQAVFDALPEQLDAVLDRLVPVGGEHREQKMYPGVDARLVEMMREIDGQPGETVRLGMLVERAAEQRRKRSVGARRQRTIAALEGQRNHLAADQRKQLLIGLVGGRQAMRQQAHDRDFAGILHPRQIDQRFDAERIGSAQNGADLRIERALDRGVAVRQVHAERDRGVAAAGERFRHLSHAEVSIDLERMGCRAVGDRCRVGQRVLDDLERRFVTGGQREDFGQAHVRLEGETGRAGPRLLAAEQVDDVAVTADGQRVGGRIPGFGAGAQIELGELSFLGGIVDQIDPLIHMIDDIEQAPVELPVAGLAEPDAADGEMYRGPLSCVDEIVGSTLHTVVQELEPPVTQRGIEALGLERLELGERNDETVVQRRRKPRRGLDFGASAEHCEGAEIETAADRGRQLQRPAGPGRELFELGAQQLGDILGHARCPDPPEVEAEGAFAGIESDQSVGMQRLQELQDKEGITAGLAMHDSGEPGRGIGRLMQRVGHEPADVLGRQRL